MEYQYWNPGVKSEARYLGDDICLNKATLLEYNKWGAKLMDEIRELPEHIQLYKLVDEMMACIEEISLSMLEDAEVAELKASIAVIQDMIDQTKPLHGVPVIVWEKLLTCPLQDLAKNIREPVGMMGATTSTTVATNTENQNEHLVRTQEWIPMEAIDDLVTIFSVHQ
jgi:hypothetical protein